MSSQTEIIPKQFNVRLNQVDTTTCVVDEGKPVPFISRHCKEMTGAIDNEQVRISLRWVKIK